MVYEVPASKASKGQDQFEFKIGDDAFRIRRLKFLSIGQAEALEAPDSVSVVLDLFGRAGTKQGDAVRSLDKEQFEALVEAWQADSGASLGESEAS
jgi:hypothetical protein